MAFGQWRDVLKIGSHSARSEYVVLHRIYVSILSQEYSLLISLSKRLSECGILSNTFVTERIVNANKI